MSKFHRFMKRETIEISRNVSLPSETNQTNETIFKRFMKRFLLFHYTLLSRYCLFHDFVYWLFGSSSFYVLYVVLSFMPLSNYLWKYTSTITNTKHVIFIIKLVGWWFNFREYSYIKHEFSCFFVFCGINFRKFHFIEMNFYSSSIYVTDDLV